MSFLIFAISDAISYVIKTTADMIVNTIYETGEIGDTFTDRIDEMLMDPEYGRPGPLKLVGAGKQIPNIGKHYYNLIRMEGSNSCRTVGLKKVENSPKPAYYIVWRLRGLDYSENITKFHERILKVEKGSTNYFIVGIKNMESYLVLSSRILHDPWKVQIEICDRIINDYDASPHKSTRVLLWGAPGLGKTEMGCFLKKKLEEKYKTITCQLICGVDPSQLCMDIRTLILNKATKSAPVVLMMDEIEK